MAIPVKLNVFEGPLDLLLHLIDKNKIDIYDIPIVEITEQYMEYIRAMDRQDLGVMSEFMVMAATLLDIKCRMLLPKEPDQEEQEDPRAELVEKLLEYKMYRYMAQELRERMDDAAGSFYKKATIPEEVLAYREPVDVHELLSGLTLERLSSLYRSLLRRQEDKIDPIRSRFGKIEREEVSVSEKLGELRAYARTHAQFSFRGILEKQQSRVQVIVTFLSMLELMKMGYVQVKQDVPFGDIEIAVMTDPSEWRDVTEFLEE